MVGRREPNPINIRNFVLTSVLLVFLLVENHLIFNQYD